MRYVPNMNNFVYAQKAEVGSFATGKVALTNSDPERIFYRTDTSASGPRGELATRGFETGSRGEVIKEKGG